MDTFERIKTIKQEGVERTLARRIPDADGDHPFQRSHLNVWCARCGRRRSSVLHKERS